MKLTICACSSRTFIDKAKVAKVAASAERSGVEVTLISDLCELCENKTKDVHAIAATTIVACHSRAVKSLMAFVGEDDVRCLNLRTGSVEDVLQALGVQPIEVGEEEAAKWMRQMEAMPRKLGDDAWYPTIDKDACAECGKCLAFCPFGVYENIEERVRVVHPHNCKNNCPACARICPAGAIIFPKYDRSPINGGEEREEFAVRLDTHELYAQTLRDRLATRRKLIR
ncbi:MAG: 4Fe-4S dicluster domain-containing protein [Bacteroidales bacterium]|nr:4Fe-4S dicluster domain-containing protein [Bacteroidales bacterium]